MNFDLLRDMESFTQTMFNNIISFQEKEHLAWNQALTFADRIKDLPLHYLVFSNADRDPEKCGPTIAHYYPLRRELQTIAEYCKKTSKIPVVIDAHARNGFIGSLLAREGLNVIGLRDNEDKPNQITHFFDESCYNMRDINLNQIDFPVDVIFSSWMPNGTDITDDIIRLKPKLIVYVYTEHTNNQETAINQTGVEGAFGENLPDNYQEIDHWEITRKENMFSDIWPDLTANIEEIRKVKIIADQAFHDLKIKPSEPDHKYDWENDLLMIETAIEAKNQLRLRGLPVDAIQ